MEKTYVIRVYELDGYGVRFEYSREYEVETSEDLLLSDGFKPCKIEKGSFYKVTCHDMKLIATEKTAYLKELEEIEKNKITIDWED